MPEQYAQLSLAWTNEPNAEPIATALKEGELALNRADGILFYKTQANDIGRFYSANSFDQGLQQSQLWIDLTQDLQNHIEDFNNPHQVTAEQVDAYTKAETDSEIDTAKNDLQIQIDDKTDDVDFQAHVNDDQNPHNVTATQVGLGNVDNTSDLDKPISTDTQAALDDKADDSALQAHIDDDDNPHNVTATQVGLGNVDNTSDLDKPISTDTQAALDDKADDSDISVVGKSNDYNDLDNKPDLSLLDNIEVFDDFDEFPSTGDSNKIYIAADTGYFYTWTGSAYVQLTGQTAVWGSISGDIEDQSDLQAALDDKADDSALQAHISTEPAHGGDLAGEPRPPEAHAGTHSTGGSDPISPSDIGALGENDQAVDVDPTGTAIAGALSLKADDADISLVGKSNDYNDLNNKPDLSLLDNNAEGFKEIIEDIGNTRVVPTGKILAIRENTIYTTSNLVLDGDIVLEDGAILIEL